MLLTRIAQQLREAQPVPSPAILREMPRAPEITVAAVAENNGLFLLSLIHI